MCHPSDAIVYAPQGELAEIEEAKREVEEERALRDRRRAGILQVLGAAPSPKQKPPLARPSKTPNTIITRPNWNDWGLIRGGLAALVIALASNAELLDLAEVLAA